MTMVYFATCRGNHQEGVASYQPQNIAEKWRSAFSFQQSAGCCLVDLKLMADG